MGRRPPLRGRPRQAIRVLRRRGQTPRGAGRGRDPPPSRPRRPRRRLLRRTSRGQSPKGQPRRLPRRLPLRRRPPAPQPRGSARDAVDRLGRRRGAGARRCPSGALLRRARLSRSGRAGSSRPRRVGRACRRRRIPEAARGGDRARPCRRRRRRVHPRRADGRRRHRRLRRDLRGPRALRLHRRRDPRSSRSVSWRSPRSPLRCCTDRRSPASALSGRWRRRSWCPRAHPNPWPVVLYLAVVVSAAYALARLRLWLWLALAAALGGALWTLLLVARSASTGVDAAYASLVVQTALAGLAFAVFPHRGESDESAEVDLVASIVLAGFALIAIARSRAGSLDSALDARPGSSPRSPRRPSSRSSGRRPRRPRRRAALRPRRSRGDAAVAVRTHSGRGAWRSRRDGRLRPDQAGSRSAVQVLFAPIWPTPQNVPAFVGVVDIGRSRRRRARGLAAALRRQAEGAARRDLRRRGDADAARGGRRRRHAPRRRQGVGRDGARRGAHLPRRSFSARGSSATVSRARRRRPRASASACSRRARSPPCRAGSCSRSTAARSRSRSRSRRSPRPSSPTASNCRRCAGASRRSASSIAGRLAYDPRIVGAALSPTPIFNWLLVRLRRARRVVSRTPAGFLRRRADDLPTRAADALAVLFAAFLVFFEIRHAMNGGDPFAPTYGLVEMGLMSVSALGFALVLTRLDAARANVVFRWASFAAGALGVGVSTLGLLLFANPFFTGTPVEGGLVVNALAVSYLLPAALASALAIQRAAAPVPSGTGRRAAAVSVGARPRLSAVAEPRRLSRLATSAGTMVSRSARPASQSRSSSSARLRSPALLPDASARSQGDKGSRRRCVDRRSRRARRVRQSHAHRRTDRRRRCLERPDPRLRVAGGALRGARPLKRAGSAFGFGASQARRPFCSSSPTRRSRRAALSTAPRSDWTCRASNAEYYAYSAVWLLLGLALLAYGMWRKSVEARLASAFFIIATTLKVFAFDLAGLEGALRALSFLGLGAALIGIGLVYQRFVFSKAPAS